MDNPYIPTFDLITIALELAAERAHMARECAGWGGACDACYYEEMSREDEEELRLYHEERRDAWLRLHG